MLTRPSSRSKSIFQCSCPPLALRSSARPQGVGNLDSGNCFARPCNCQSQAIRFTPSPACGRGLGGAGQPVRVSVSITDVLFRSTTEGLFRTSCPPKRANSQWMRRPLTLPSPAHGRGSKIRRPRSRPCGCSRGAGFARPLAASPQGDGAIAPQGEAMSPGR